MKGRLFHGTYPDGSPIEAYILTSQLGAARIRQRAGLLGLADRIEDMLIVVPPPPPPTTDSSSSSSSGDTSSIISSDIDISLIPKLLYDKYDMRLIDHDGGHKVLAAFARSGALCQMDLTLGRGLSVKEVLATAAMDSIPEPTRTSMLDQFDDRVKDFKFFHKKLDPILAVEADVEAVAMSEGQCSYEAEYSSAIPSSFEVASIITNDQEDVAVVTFRMPSSCDFYQLSR